MTLAQDLGAWHDFWVFAGGAAATLAGLVFVAISLRPKEILGAASARFLARGSFFGFFTVVGMCAIALMPWGTGVVPGSIFIVLAVVGAVPTLRGIVELRRLEPASVALTVRRGVIPTVAARVLMLVGGALLIIENSYTFSILAVSGTILMMAAAQNAWVLVVFTEGS